MIKDKHVITLESRNMEFRILNDGNLEINGKIKYNSRSGSLFSKKHKAFFTEQINPMAFTSCLNQQQEQPVLIFNHNMKDTIEVISFKYEELVNKEFKFTYVVIPNEKLLSNLDKITNFSFGMVVNEDEWKRINVTGIEYLRIIKSFKKVYEFSLLIGLESAYSSARIYIDDKEMHKEEINQFILEAKEFLRLQKKKEIEELKRFISSKR